MSPLTTSTTATVSTPVVEADFQSLGISSQIADILTKMKISIPTPIQAQSIPVGLEGKDIMGIAQTGTGKTLAFGIPMVERLNRMKGRGLILLPTRELAEQVNESFQNIGRAFQMRTAVLIGGESMHRQIQMLRANPRVIIATPGRLIDHMQQGLVRLDDIQILVLDEADRMLDMGFAPQLNQLLKRVPTARQTMLCSATMPQGVLKLATTYMALPVRVEVAPAGTASVDVEQEIFIVRQESKLSLLERLLQDYKGTVLVFTRTKYGAKKITNVIRMMGHSIAEIHSNRSQVQRREALAGFKAGKYRILAATDIAARGIDVNNIELVVNFDLPDHLEDYVHRIGRTGRAGKKGRAISFATPEQRGDIRGIERLIRKNLEISRFPEGEKDLPPSAPMARRPAASMPSSRPSRGRAPQNSGESRWRRSGSGRSEGGSRFR